MYVEWTREQAWELTLSYLTCVKLWLIGDHWDINTMKTIALDKMSSITQGLKKTPSHILNSSNGEKEGAHLASFIRALNLANKHPWHAKLWKELYDSGTELAPKLKMLPGFAYYVRNKKDGADFAQAIGLKDLALERAGENSTAMEENTNIARNNGGFARTRAAGEFNQSPEDSVTELDFVKGKKQKSRREKRGSSSRFRRKHKFKARRKGTSG